MIINDNQICVLAPHLANFPNNNKKRTEKKATPFLIFPFLSSFSALVQLSIPNN